MTKYKNNKNENCNILNSLNLQAYMYFHIQYLTNYDFFLIYSI